MNLLLKLKAWPFEAHLNPGSGDGVGHKLLFLVAV